MSGLFIVSLLCYAVAAFVFCYGLHQCINHGEGLPGYLMVIVLTVLLAVPGWLMSLADENEKKRAAAQAEQIEQCRELCGLSVPIECSSISSDDTLLRGRTYAICYGGDHDDWVAWLEFAPENGKSE